MEENESQGMISNDDHVILIQTCQDKISSERALKRRHWTPEEDKILKDYVAMHGPKNWKRIGLNSGLNRCGKSCRLRWKNHLMSNVKKGFFSAEEETAIATMHFSMGTKWSAMAKQLPGRSDNEIKNFWHTRAKRCAKLGLPVYPPGVLHAAANIVTANHSSADNQEMLENMIYSIQEVDSMHQSGECYQPSDNIQRVAEEKELPPMEGLEAHAMMQSQTNCLPIVGTTDGFADEMQINSDLNPLDFDFDFDYNFDFDYSIRDMSCI